MIFITGANSEYEDILDWFIHHYNKHISRPLYIADFGLRNKYPNTIQINWKDNPWYYKPRAMIEAPGEQVCWIDCDCEIRSDISDVFELTGAADFGLTQDWCNRRYEWATGLICVNSKQPLYKWAEICEYREYRGDQEVFDTIKNFYQIKELPREYQWLRLEGDNPECKVMHWTGQKGKEHIRNVNKSR